MTKKTGQVTLLVLLLGLLGLTVGLAVVSRSLSDIKQSTRSDIGSRALAVAEAAAQYAAATITAPSQTDCTGTLTYSRFDSNQLANFPGFSEISYASCTSSKSSINFGSLTPNSVIQLDLSQLTGSAKNLDLIWNGSASIEAVYLDKNNVVTRYAVNGVDVAGATNNFTPLTSQGATNCINNVTNSSTCPVDTNTYKSCLEIAPAGNLKNDKLIRVRILYQASPLLICGDKQSSGNNNGVDLGSPVYGLIGRAKSTDGTVRRVMLTRNPPALSGVFDFALYSEGTIVP